MTLRRGFKSEAERIANRVRTELGLRGNRSVTPHRLAKHLGVDIRQGDELVDRQRFEELAQIQADAFSACTLEPKPNRVVVVLNPLSSPGRQSSDLAHELAHILLDHELSTIEKLGDFTFLTCDGVQEEEANWLAGCLLLPRPLLLNEARKKSTPDQIAEKYKVSRTMAAFRMNVTGVKRQVNAWNSKAKASRSTRRM